MHDGCVLPSFSPREVDEQLTDGLANDNSPGSDPFCRPAAPEASIYFGYTLRPYGDGTRGKGGRSRRCRLDFGAPGLQTPVLQFWANIPVLGCTSGEG